MSDKLTVEDVVERLEIENIVLLDAEQRDELRAGIVELFEEADKEDDEDTMTAMLRAVEDLNRYEQIIEEINAESEKEETAETEDEAVDESEEKGEAEEPAEEKAEEETEEKAEEADEEVKSEETTEADADAAEDQESGTVEETQEEVAMAASALTGDDVPEDRKPIAKDEHVSVAVTAGSDLRGFTAGAEFRNIDEVNRAFLQKLDAIRGSRMGDGEKRTVVALVAAIEEGRQLTDNVADNLLKIDGVTGETALVASGGYCAPLPVNYDIFGVGSSIRPVRDSLPSFGATRGGIRYIAPPVLGAYNSAISLWTAANDADPEDPETKPTLKVTCASEQTATADAVTLSLEFGNLMARAFPELVQRHNQLALIQHARFAERTLLNKISAASTKVTVSHDLGASRDLLVAIAKASAAYRNRHRIPRPIKLRAILPEWTRDLLREDIASNMAIENLAVTDSVMDSWFAARGLSISWHIDDTFASQSNNAPLNPFPSSIKFWVFAEGTFLFLDGGTLDLGVIRDSDLVSTNDYRTFVETFEGIAKVGIESLEVVATTTIGVNSGS